MELETDDEVDEGTLDAEGDEEKNQRDRKEERKEEKDGLRSPTSPPPPPVAPQSVLRRVSTSIAASVMSLMRSSSKPQRLHALNASALEAAATDRLRALTPLPIDDELARLDELGHSALRARLAVPSSSRLRASHSSSSLSAASSSSGDGEAHSESFEEALSGDESTLAPPTPIETTPSDVGWDDSVVSELQRRLAEAEERAASAEASARQDSKAEMEALLKEMDASYRRRLDTARAAIRDPAQALAKALQRTDELEDALEAAHKSVADAKRARDEAVAATAEREEQAAAEAERSQSTLAAAVERAEAQCSRLAATVAARDSRILELASALADVEESLHAARADIESEKDRTKEVGSQAREAEAKATVAQTRLEESEARIAEAERRSTEAEAAFSDVKAQLCQALARSSDAEERAARAEVAAAEAKNAAAVAAAALVDAKARASEASKKAVAKFEELQASLTALKGDQEATAAKWERAKRAALEHRSRADGLEAEKKRLEDALGDAKAALSQAGGHEQELSKRFERAKKAAGEHRERADGLEKKLGEAQQALAASNAALETSERDREAVARRVAQLEEQFEALEATLAEARDRSGELEQCLGRAVAELDARRADIKERLSERDTLQERLQRAVLERDEANARSLELQGERDFALEKIVRLEAERGTVGVEGAAAGDVEPEPDQEASELALSPATAEEPMPPLAYAETMRERVPSAGTSWAPASLAPKDDPLPSPLVLRVCDRTPPLRRHSEPAEVGERLTQVLANHAMECEMLEAQLERARTASRERLERLQAIYEAAEALGIDPKALQKRVTEMCAARRPPQGTPHAIALQRALAAVRASRTPGSASKFVDSCIKTNQPPETGLELTPSTTPASRLGASCTPRPAAAATLDLRPTPIGARSGAGATGEGFGLFGRAVSGLASFDLGGPPADAATAPSPGPDGSTSPNPLVSTPKLPHAGRISSTCPSTDPLAVQPDEDDAEMFVDASPVPFALSERCEMSGGIALLSPAVTHVSSADATPAECRREVSPGDELDRFEDAMLEVESPSKEAFGGMPSQVGENEEMEPQETLIDTLGGGEENEEPTPEEAPVDALGKEEEDQEPAPDEAPIDTPCEKDENEVMAPQEAPVDALGKEKEDEEPAPEEVPVDTLGGLEKVEAPAMQEDGSPDEQEESTPSKLASADAPKGVSPPRSSDLPKLKRGAARLEPTVSTGSEPSAFHEPSLDAEASDRSTSQPSTSASCTSPSEASSTTSGDESWSPTSEDESSSSMDAPDAEVFATSDSVVLEGSSKPIASAAATASSPAPAGTVLPHSKLPAQTCPTPPSVQIVSASSPTNPRRHVQASLLASESPAVADSSPRTSSRDLQTRSKLGVEDAGHSAGDTAENARDIWSGPPSPTDGARTQPYILLEPYRAPVLPHDTFEDWTARFGAEKTPHRKCWRVDEDVFEAWRGGVEAAARSAWDAEASALVEAAPVHVRANCDAAARCLARLVVGVDVAPLWMLRGPKAPKAGFGDMGAFFESTIEARPHITYEPCLVLDGDCEGHEQIASGFEHLAEELAHATLDDSAPLRLHAGRVQRSNLSDAPGSRRGNARPPSRSGQARRRQGVDTEKAPDQSALGKRKSPLPGGSATPSQRAAASDSQADENEAPEPEPNAAKSRPVRRRRVLAFTPSVASAMRMVVGDPEPGADAGVRSRRPRAVARRIR